MISDFLQKLNVVDSVESDAVINICTRMALRRQCNTLNEFVFTPSSISFSRSCGINERKTNAVIEFKSGVAVNEDDAWNSAEVIRNLEKFKLTPDDIECAKELFSEFTYFYNDLAGRSIDFSPMYAIDLRSMDLNFVLSLNLDSLLKYIDLTKLLQANRLNGSLNQESVLSLNFERFKLRQAYADLPMSKEQFKLIRADHHSEVIDRGCDLGFNDYYKWYTESRKRFKLSDLNDEVGLREWFAIELEAAILDFMSNPRHNIDSISYWINRNFNVHPIHQRFTTSLIEKLLSDRECSLNSDSVKYTRQKF